VMCDALPRFGRDLLEPSSAPLCIAAAVLESDLVGMTAALVLPPVFVHTVNTLRFFRSHKEFTPRLAIPETRTAIGLIKGGGLFFAMTSASIVSLNLDAVIVLRVLGPAAATECGIAIKLVSALQAVITVMMLPYWPTYASPAAAKSASGVRGMLWRSTGVSLLFAIPAALLIGFVGNDIIRLWISHDEIVEQSLLDAATVWIPLFAIGASVAACANSTPFVKAQVLMVGAVAVIAAKIMVTNIMGMSSVLWGAILIYPLVVLIPTLAAIERRMYRWRALARLSCPWRFSVEPPRPCDTNLTPAGTAAMG
jgi:O-antigen/teichoic acid export membrane protein